MNGIIVDWGTAGHWAAVIGFEVLIVVGVAAAACKATRSAFWRRAIWQACLMGLLGLILCETTGTSQVIASWTKPAERKDKTVRISSQLLANAPVTTPPVTMPAPAPELAAPAIDNALLPQEMQPRAEVFSFQSNVQDQPKTPVAIINPSDHEIQTIPSRWGALWKSISPLEWCILVWAMGTGILLGRAFLVRLLLSRFRQRASLPAEANIENRVRVLADRLGLNRPIRIVASSRLPGPVAFGVLRPTIALPDDFAVQFNAKERDTILIHELAHLAGCDPAWWLLSDCVAAALWWHPLVWWARYRLQQAMEMFADEGSLVVSDGPGILAECLVRHGARLLKPATAGSFAATGGGFRSGLGQRVRRLMEIQNHSWKPPGKKVALSFRIAGTAILACASLFCTAWISPESFQKGELTMKSLRQNWKQTVGVLALVSGLNQDAQSITVREAPAIKDADNTIQKESAEKQADTQLWAGDRTDEIILKDLILNPNFRENEKIKIEIISHGFVIHFLGSETSPIFDSADSAQFSQFGAWLFDTFAWEVARYRFVSIDVEGYAYHDAGLGDSKADLQQISTDRANAAKDRLTKLRVRKSLFKKVAGYGDTKAPPGQGAKPCLAISVVRSEGFDQTSFLPNVFQMDSAIAKRYGLKSAVALVASQPWLADDQPDEAMVKDVIQDRLLREDRRIKIDVVTNGINSIAIHFLDKETSDPIFDSTISAEFSKSGGSLFDSIAFEIARYPFAAIKVEGYAYHDARLGSFKVDTQQISIDRANAARDRLTKAGVPESKFKKVAGYGDAKVALDNGTKRCLTILVTSYNVRLASAAAQPSSPVADTPSPSQSDEQDKSTDSGRPAAPKQNSPPSIYTIDPALARRYGLLPSAPVQSTPTEKEKSTNATEQSSNSIYRMDPALALRYGLIPGGQPPSVTVPSTKSYEAREISQKLDEMIIDEVSYNEVPLQEVIKDLYFMSRKLDHKGGGVNFLLNVSTPPPITGIVDPVTGIPVPPNGNDGLGQVILRLNPPLHKVKLKDLLAAITKVASQPITYSIENFGVEFSFDTTKPFNAYGLTANPSPSSHGTLQVGTFTLEEEALQNGVQVFELPASEKNNSRALAQEFVAKLGVSVDRPNLVFYNAKTGILMVRATQAELDLIRAAVETLSGNRADGQKAVQRKTTGSKTSGENIEDRAVNLVVPVLGCVEKSGLVSLPVGSQSILDAIAAAGGFSKSANKNSIDLSRDGKSSRFTLKDLQNSTTDRTSLKVGDRIVVNEMLF